MRFHAYRLLTEIPAKKKAKKLIEIVALMGFDIKLARSQELIARLMGYDDWAELVRVTRATPERGVPDQMLPPKDAEDRRKCQVELLARELGIDDWSVESLRTALAPTGEGHRLEWPTVEKFGLRLAAEDLAWIEESMALVRDFDAAIRPLYAMANDPGNGLIRVRLESIEQGERKFYNRRPSAPDDIVNWVAYCFPKERPLVGKQLADVTQRAKSAYQAFSALDTRIRALGSAPMIAPVDWTFLKLSRSHVTSGESRFYTAIDPEPWLHIGFDLPGFCFNPENEWNASRALALQLALRREFLDSGWTGEGEEWTVTFRDGNSARERINVRAPSAGAAYAWAAAARGALRLAKQQSVGSFSLISVAGPQGVADPERALAVAVNETVIQRGRLLEASKMRIRGLRKAA